MTIAYYSSNSTGTQACAYYQTATSAFTNVNGGTCTATSSTTTPLWVQVTVAVTASGADPVAVSLNQLHIAPIITRAYTMEVAP
jgi:hypothetical protein